MNRVDFFVRCVPPRTTFQQKKVFYNAALGRVQFVKKKSLEQAEQDFMSLFAPHAPKEPFRTAVRLGVVFVYPFRKTERKGVRERLLVPMTVKPDFDNLSKTLCDVLTKLYFWTDDALVAEAHVSKFWGASPGILISIEEIANYDKTVREHLEGMARIGFIKDGLANDGDLFGGVNG